MVKEHIGLRPETFHKLRFDIECINKIWALGVWDFLHFEDIIELGKRDNDKKNVEVCTLKQDKLEIGFHGQHLGEKDNFGGSNVIKIYIVIKRVFID